MKCEEKKSPEVAIGLVEARWKKAKQDVEDANYLERLIHADLIRTIRSYQTIWDYCDEVIAKAQKQIGKKYKRERPDFEYIQSKIREDFFEDSKAVKVIEIMQGGIEGYYWSFALDTGDKEEYSIQVPRRKKRTVSNADYSNMGKFIFFLRTSPCCISAQFSSYDEADFAEKIKEYFKKKAGI